MMLMLLVIGFRIWSFDALLGFFIDGYKKCLNCCLRINLSDICQGQIFLLAFIVFTGVSVS